MVWINLKYFAKILVCSLNMSCRFYLLHHSTFENRCKRTLVVLIPCNCITSAKIHITEGIVCIWAKVTYYYECKIVYFKDVDWGGWYIDMYVNDRYTKNKKYKLYSTRQPSLSTQFWGEAFEARYICFAQFAQKSLMRAMETSAIWPLARTAHDYVLWSKSSIPRLPRNITLGTLDAICVLLLDFCFVLDCACIISVHVIFHWFACLYVVLSCKHVISSKYISVMCFDFGT